MTVCCFPKVFYYGDKKADFKLNASDVFLELHSSGTLNDAPTPTAPPHQKMESQIILLKLFESIETKGAKQGILYWL